MLEEAHGGNENTGSVPCEGVAFSFRAGSKRVMEALIILYEYRSIDG